MKYDFICFKEPQFESSQQKNLTRTLLITFLREIDRESFFGTHGITVFGSEIVIEGVLIFKPGSIHDVTFNAWQKMFLQNDLNFFIDGLKMLSDSPCKDSSSTRHIPTRAMKN